jgi:hypothetical protein
MPGLGVNAFLKRAFVPGAAFLGAGLSAVGVIYNLPWLTFLGALMAAFAALTAAVWQAEWNETIETQGQTIAAQAVRIESMVTGGNGFAYLSLTPTNSPNVFMLVAINGGNFPLYEVSARVVDITAMAASLNPMQFPSPFDFQLPIGSMAVSAAAVLPRQLTTPLSAPSQDFNIFFSGRNGFWTQEERIRLLPNGMYVRATRITRDGVVLHESIAPSFPLNAQGNLDW